MDRDRVRLDRFDGRAVIVTGAAGGIGLATARRFRAEGARVLLVDHAEAALARIHETLAAEPGPAIDLLVCDVAVEAQVEAACDRALADWGGLDVVVNVAGMMIYAPIEEISAEDWSRLLGVNLMGAVFFTKHAFRRMRPGGAIVNISSVHAQQTSPLVAPYAAAKAALLALTRSAAIEGQPKGLRVNAIAPGAIDTPMLWSSPNLKSGAEVLKPGDVGEADDIAAAVAFLASDDARFITGATLNVDGGRLAKL